MISKKNKKVAFVDPESKKFSVIGIVNERKDLYYISRSECTNAFLNSIRKARLLRTRSKANPHRSWWPIKRW